MSDQIPTSDIQHVAQMLVKVRDGDQILSPEAHRLNEIAEFGYTKGTPVPSNAPELFDAPPLDYPSATRVER